MEDSDRREVQAILKRFEFAAEVVVETSDRKTADLRVSDPSGGAYLIEVKGRLGSNFEGHLSDHGVAESFVTLAYANSVSKQVAEAADQLGASSSQADELQLIWFHNLDEDEHQRVVKTLYGIVTVVQPSSNGGAESVECLYLTFSEFLRCPGIAGAVLGNSDSGILYPNLASPACGRLRTSRLFQVFVDHTAVWDPAALESRGDVYIADCAGSRKPADRAILLSYLKDKYSVAQLIDVEPKHARVAVAIPRGTSSKGSGDA